MPLRARPIVLVAPLLLVGFMGAAFLLSRPPVELSLGGAVEPSGTVDAHGQELWLAHVWVSNRSSGMLQFEWGQTEAYAKAGSRWLKCEPMELLWNPRRLLAHEKRELLMVISPETSACRIRLQYQPELFKWQVWRRMGLRGQSLAARVPGRLAGRIWPKGQFGEQPPAGNSFRQPPHWTSFTAEVPIPKGFAFAFGRPARQGGSNDQSHD